MKNTYFFVPLVACCALSACGPAVTSTSIETLSPNDVAVGRNQGEVYYMPRAVLMARLLVSPTRGMRVVIDTPDIVADTGAPLITAAVAASPATRCAIDPPVVRGPFILNHRITGLHKDTITIATTESLLTSVIADTEEQTSEALSNLAKSVGTFAAESATAADDEEILALRFDPADCQEIGLVQAKIRAAIDGAGLVRLQAMHTTAAAKSPFAKLMLTSRQPSDFTLSLAGFAPFRLPVTARSAPDCRIGICVPVQVPASIVVETAGYRRESPILHLPNRSDPVAIPVSRSTFADVKTTLTLDRGILTKREIVRSSEVAAILLLPATLVGAYLDQVSATFKKRKIALDDQVAWRKAQEAAREKAENADLAGGKPLLEFPLPGLSVGGVPSGSGPVQAEVPAEPGPDVGKPTTAKESPSSDGDAGSDVTAATKGKADGKNR